MDSIWNRYVVKLSQEQEKRIKKGLTAHAINAVGMSYWMILTAGTLEKYVALMPDNTWLTTRVQSAVLLFLGVAEVAKKLRQISYDHIFMPIHKKLFGKNAQLKRKSQIVYDALFHGVTSILYSPPMYLAAQYLNGYTNYNEMWNATVVSVIASVIAGPFLGGVNDLSYKFSPRKPENQKSSYLAKMLTSSSHLLTGTTKHFKKIKGAYDSLSPLKKFGFETVLAGTLFSMLYLGDATKSPFYNSEKHTPFHKNIIEQHLVPVDNQERVAKKDTQFLSSTYRLSIDDYVHN